MNSFKLSQNITNDKIFIRNRSELEGRLDPYFYLSDFTNVINKINQRNSIKFSHLIKCITNGLDDRSFVSEGLPYYRVANINHGFMDFNNIKYISDKKIFKNINLEKHDLLITRKGSFGRVFSVIDESDAVISSEIFNVKLKNKQLSKYLEILLNLSIGQVQFDRHKIGAIMGSLSQEAIKNILIPLAEEKLRDVVVYNYENAYEIKQKKELEAQALLNSIDDYLMKELGIALPKTDNSLKSRIFSKNLSDIQGNRWDVFYHKPWFDNFYNDSLYPIKKLSSILKFIESGSRPKGGVSNITKGVLSLGGEHVCESGNINISSPKYISLDYHNNNLKTATKLYDLLLVKDGATTGKIGIIENTQLINQNINEHLFILRVDERVITPYFTFFLLHTKIMQMQIVKNKTGATVTGLTKRVTKNLQLPVPPISKQNEIVAHIQSIRNKADQLQKEAQQQFEDTKKQIEKMILGEDI